MGSVLFALASRLGINPWSEWVGSLDGRPAVNHAGADVAALAAEAERRLAEDER